MEFLDSGPSKPFIVHVRETRYKRTTPAGQHRFELDCLIELIAEHINIPAQYIHGQYSLAYDIKRVVYHGRKPEILQLLKRLEAIDPLRSNAQLFTEFNRLLLTDAK